MKLFSYLKPFRLKICLQLSIKIIGTLIELAIPFVLSYILDSIIPKNNIKEIILYGILMFACAFFACYFNVIANRMAAKCSKSVTYAIRRDLFNQILNLPKDKTDEIGDSKLTANITSDTYNIFQMIGISLRLGIRSPFLLIGGIIITLILDYRLALVLIACVPIIALIVAVTCYKNLKQFNSSLKKSENLITSIKENINGIKVIKALDKIDYEKEKFEVLNKDVSKLEKKAQIMSGVLNPILTFILDIGLVLVIFYGAYLAKNNLTEPGIIVAFITYFAIISNALISISRIFQTISKGVTSLNRIKYVFSFPIEEYEKNDLTSDYYIEFKDVSFKINDKYILKDINFTLNKGETLGIIGKSGSGKTTLINLLLRIYKPTQGNIYINHIEINNYEKHALNDLFGVVFQTDILFSDSIENNIKLFKEYDEEQLNEALINSDALKIVNLHEESTKYKLTRGALNLSGGQRQRLLIARALIKKPEILILDDSFSALDYKTDLLIRTNLKKYNKTNIFIAQRISSIKKSDKIIVLNNGTIEAIGKDEELVNCSLYNELKKSQEVGDFDAE